MGVTVDDLVVYRYEKQPSDFRVGELVHNFNGNDYRVMENYGGGDVLLMQMNTGMFVVAEGIEAYKRYPKDDMPTAENTQTGIEWGIGIYLGNDIASISFRKLKVAGQAGKEQTAFYKDIGKSKVTSVLRQKST